MKKALILVLFVAGCSTAEPEWTQRNQRVIDEFKITGRTRELPDVRVPLSLTPGQPVENAALPTATLAPGVVARLAWGRGALLEQVDMQANAVYPEQTLAEELIVIVRDGSACAATSSRAACTSRRDRVSSMRRSTRPPKRNER